MSTQFTNRQWRLPNNENKDKQSNYSMSFDGSSDYVSINLGSQVFNNDFSFSFWMKPTSIGSNTILVHLGSTSAYSDGFRLYQVGNNFDFWSGVGGYTKIFNAVQSAPLNSWSHVVITRSGSSLVFYLNGSSVSTATNSNSFTSTALQLAYNQYQLYQGQIDAFSIYNYALSSSQVTTLYGSSSTGIGNPMSLSPKPVAYYPLGDQDAFNGANYLVPNSSLKDYVFDFDGSNDYIDCGNVTSLNNLSAFSTSTWINYEGTISGPSSHMFLSGGSASNNRFYVQLYSSNQIRYGYNGNTIVTTSSMSSGSWYNIVTVHNGTSLDVYLNGVKQNTSTVTVVAPSTNIGNSFQIGKYFALSSYYFNGQLSNAQIFNTALPATGSNSVETLYNNGSPLTSMSGFTSLVGWWKLDASDTYDGTNWTIEDHAGTNDGTSSGMTQANLVQSDLSFKTSISPFALDFDSASSDYISLPTITLTDNWSVSVWMNKIDFANRSQAVGTSTGIGFWAYGGDIRSGGSTAGKLVYYNGTSLVVLSNERLDDGNWHNWIISYDHSTTTLKCYIDGQENYSDTYNAGTGNTINRISNTFASNYWIGQLSNISIWNTDLTSAQVTELYNEGVPSNLNNHSAYSNLVSWWQLGSNSSFNTNWTVLDEKGSNNGTSANMGEDAIVDGVGSYANGLSSGMGGDEVIGDAPYSTANALSVNMDVEDRVTDTPS